MNNEKNYFCVVLNNKQGWLKQSEFKIQIQKISNELGIKYNFYEFEKSYNNGCEYVYFMSYDDKNDSKIKCDNIVNKLKTYNICAYTIKNNELNNKTFSIPLYFLDKMCESFSKDNEAFIKNKHNNFTNNVVPYAIILKNYQPWLDPENFDNILFDISKKFDINLYPKFGIEESYIDNNEPFIFVKSNDFDLVNNIKNELVAKKIVFIIEENYKITKFDEDYFRIVKFGNAVFRKNSDYTSRDGEKERTIKQISKEENHLSTVLSIDKMKKYDSFFEEKIIGQKEAVELVKKQLIKILYKYEQNNKDNKPAGIFFFAGPTGVGKTELCKVLSDFIYSNSKINRFDMSEFSKEGSIWKLIGSDTGYIGSEEDGALIKALKTNPNSIILFDEIEKSDKSTFDIFLQMFDEGFITSNKGEKYYLKDNFLVLTSNIGASYINEFDSHETTTFKIKNEVEDFFVNTLNRPEILGRIGKDNIIVFDLISKKEDQYKIIDIAMKKFKKPYIENNCELIYDKNSLYDEILKNVDIKLGARNIIKEFEKFDSEFTLSLFDLNIQFKDLSNKKLGFHYKNGIIEINIINN